MKTPVLSVLILTSAIGISSSYSQQAAAPVTQFSDSTSVPLLVAGNDPTALISAPEPSSSSSAGFVSRPPAAPVHARVFDRSYALVNAMHLGMAMFDIEMTQHCEAQHTCREANPFMPSSQAGALGVSLGFFAYSATGSYFMKKHNSKMWWLPSAMGIGTHVIGVYTGFAHE